MGVVTNYSGVAVSGNASAYSEHPLSVSNKLLTPRPRKSRSSRRKRRKARSPGLKGVTLVSSLLKARRAVQGEVG